MKHTRIVSLLTLITLSGCGAGTENSELFGVSNGPTRKIMALQSTPDAVYAALAQIRHGEQTPALANLVADESNAKTYDYVNVMALTITATEAQQLAKLGLVSAVSENKLLRKFDTHEKPFSWGLDRIDQTSPTPNNLFGFPYQAGEGVRAYIIDTGIDSAHPEFTGRMLPGFNSVKDDKGTQDCEGHGTHVAGTVAGRRVGVAKKALLVPVRVLDCKGSGSAENVIAGMDWVISQKVQNPSVPFVANMSLGAENIPAVDEAALRMWNAGIFLVVAAGNEYGDACRMSPARAPSAITVGATTKTDQKAGFSNFGKCVDIYAPGDDIFSAAAGTKGGVVMGGTSMASPHVAGAAALILSKSLQATNAQVEDALKSRSLRDVVGNVEKGALENLLLRIEEASVKPGDSTPQPIPQTERPIFEYSYSTTLQQDGYDSFYTTSASMPAGNIIVSAEFAEPKQANITVTLFRFNDGTKKFEQVATQIRTGADTGKLQWKGPAGLLQWIIKSSGYAGNVRLVTSF